MLYRAKETIYGLKEGLLDLVSKPAIWWLSVTRRKGIGYHNKQKVDEAKMHIASAEKDANRLHHGKWEDHNDVRQTGSNILTKLLRALLALGDIEE